MNEIQLLREQLAAERRHVRCVLEWFDERDARLGALYHGRLAGIELA